MPHLRSNLFKKLNLGNIWIFITERCNLNCDYCFFTGRGNKTTLSFNQILSLLEFLPTTKAYDFVISGGEPLLSWRLVKKTFSYLTKTYPKAQLTLQTNMTLLSSSVIDTLKSHKVIIEPGIDGDFLTNYRHRKGLNNTRYEVCLDKLKSVVESGLKMNPTMTVHPREASLMFDNFKKLVSLGLNTIEVHPAFMADWDNESSREFIKQYKKIIAFEKKSGSYLVCKSYSSKVRPSLDLVIQPDGYILPNWTFLTFPYKIRKDFFIMKLRGKGLKIYNSVLLKYLKSFHAFFESERSYREFSNFNASLIIEALKSKELRRKFLVYNRLCEIIQDLDRPFLRKEDSLYGHKI